MFDDIFGGMFDFDGDGHTDFIEEAIGFAILDEMSKEESDDYSSDDEAEDNI